MSWTQFEDDCPGCKPAMLDLETGARLPDDHPNMQAVFAVWAATTLEERQAFHRVCCQNSPLPDDIVTMRSLAQRIQDACERKTSNPC